MSRFALFATGVSALLGAGLPVLGEVALTEKGVNSDGVVNEAGFNTTTGLGSISVTITGAGAHKSYLFLDHELSSGINTFFIMIVVIWIQAGFSTVVISAALKGVPDDLVEAARIDGATDRQAFYKVVLPYIKGTIITVATTTTIAVLKIFDIIQTMGKGGSFGTSSIANEMYEQGFPQDNEGLGAAWAVLLFLLVVPIVFVNARNQKAMREAR